MWSDSKEDMHVATGITQMTDELLSLDTDGMKIATAASTGLTIWDEYTCDDVPTLGLFSRLSIQMVYK